MTFEKIDMCDHEWEYCAVVNRGTDYICQKCKTFLSSNPEKLAGTGKIVSRGPVHLDKGW